MRLALLAALAAAALAACDVGRESAPPPPSAPPDPATITTAEPPPPPPTTTEPEPGVEPVGLVPTPEQALRRCRRVPALAPACPRAVPQAPWDPGSPLYRAHSRRDTPGAGAWTFELGWSGEHPGEPERDRPPATVHVVVTSWPTLADALARQTRLRDGLLSERRRRTLVLGRRTWGGREGVLLLAPGYPRGGIEANHLVFAWLEGGRKSVSLHGWEPITEVPAVLRATVESIPPPR